MLTTLSGLPASPEDACEHGSALDVHLSRGATRRGGSPESHPVPHSPLPAAGLCDLEAGGGGAGLWL